MLRRVILCALPFGLLGCGRASPPPPAAQYSAEQLNAFALRPPPEEIVGIATPARGPVVVPEAPPPPPPRAFARVLHASPDPALATVAVYVNDGATPAIASLAYRNAAGYAELPTGNLNVALRPAAAAPTTPPSLAGLAQTLEADKHYTVIAFGQQGPGPAGGQLALASTEDNNAEPEAGHARVRFFHALLGAGTVDACVPGGAPGSPAQAVFSNAAFGRWGPLPSGPDFYASVPAGSEITVQLRAHAATACTGRVLGQVTLNPPERSVLTLVAVGRSVAAAGRPASREFLVCTDAPLTGPSLCLAMPVRPAGPAPARPAGAAATRTALVRPSTTAPLQPGQQRVIPPRP